jgi:hypothetical protein
VSSKTHVADDRNVSLEAFETIGFIIRINAPCRRGIYFITSRRVYKVASWLEFIKLIGFRISSRRYAGRMLRV